MKKALANSAKKRKFAQTGSEAMTETEVLELMNRIEQQDEAGFA